jgi:WS/DGAT/MGAT family acyltransferase
MIDGISGVDLALVLSDLTPDAEPPPPPATPWQPAPPADPLALLEEAVRDSLVEAARRWTDQTFEQFRPAEAAVRSRRMAEALTASMPRMLQPAPRTPFNGPLSPERGVAWVDVDFADVRRIKSVLGGTVNDLVLALIAGGLGRYLRHHGYPTNGVELRANCPVSMRRAEERGALGNRISLLITPLYIGVRDPVERLRLQRAAMERLKEQDQAGALYALTSQGNQAPAWMQALAGQIEVPNTLYNTVCTNVPGPQIPLYLNGKKALGGPGFGNLTANIGLFNGIGSYNGILGISATVDPRQFPDPWFYIDCLKESYEELRAAARTDAVAA